MDKQKIKEVILKYKDGDEFTAKIRGQEVSGKISIEEHSVYLCHDYPRSGYDGLTASNKHGYSKSWQLDDEVSDLVITKKDSVINTYNIF